MKKLLIIVPHLSTGGCPQVVVNKIELLKDTFKINVIEWSELAFSFVVQKNRIWNLLGSENCISFPRYHEHKIDQLKQIIDHIQPDVISLEEFPEFFMESEAADYIYKEDRPWLIFETTHDSTFDVNRKVYFPDKFLFVSAYSALKFAHLDIPFEVIEYPVDLKYRNQTNAIKKLGLNDQYKHIVIVGLFTPRKNQKYAFEIAERLKDYRVMFHFIGNMADNFADYWKPLIENKPDNCIIWGERDDTDTFIQAADLFLFPSYGDRNNKELNPIVIKEATQYCLLPVKMFNLDVYLQKYSSDETISFLTGNIEKDTTDILDQLELEKIQKGHELIIIGTYPDTSKRKQLTKECITSFSGLGREIMLVSHYPVSEDIQQMVDYYIYDKHNPLIHHSYYNNFYNNTEDYDVTINIKGNSNQSLAVLTNLFNGVNAAEKLGYLKIMYITFDVILQLADRQEVEKAFSKIGSQDNYYYLCKLKTPMGWGVQTTAMAFDVSIFEVIFHNVRNQEDFCIACLDVESHNFLEDYMAKALQRYDPDQLYGTLIENNEETFLKNSGLGVSSNSEYYAMLPVEGVDNVCAFYFYTYNIDGIYIRSVLNGIKFYEKSVSPKEPCIIIFPLIDLPKTIEIFLDDPTFSGGTRKKEVYTITKDNIHELSNNGLIKYKKEIPQQRHNIKLVHLQTDRNMDKEIISRENMVRVMEYGIEYRLIRNTVCTEWNDLLAVSVFSLRPLAVSNRLFTPEETAQLGTALTPAHYGCYKSFVDAIMNEFSEDLDYLILCEGDCILEVPIEEFIDTVHKVCDIIKQTNIGYFSFGDHSTLDTGVLQSPVIKEVPGQDLLYITNHIIGLQCIMFTKAAVYALQEAIKTTNWDAADIFFNYCFNDKEKLPFDMGILKKRITSQADGYSLIDQTEKSFIKK